MPRSFIISQIGAVLALAGHLVEAAFEPVEIFFPDPGEVRPASRCKTVVARQRIGQNTKVGCALHVVVAAEDIRSAA